MQCLSFKGKQHWSNHASSVQTHQHSTSASPLPTAGSPHYHSLGRPFLLSAGGEVDPVCFCLE